MSVMHLSSRLRVHSVLRWSGVVLFLAALPGVGLLIHHVIQGTSPASHLLACVMALGVSLGAFGTNNDTAVHAMRELADVGALPGAFRDELAEERRFRPKELVDVHASVKAALVFPLLAACAVAWLYYRAGTPG
ncbi:MAG: hypothetical protein EXR69_03195 [Myxococcales bacterium]|nr:hypothetical protein [Myxococcales bacterium]